MSRSENMGEVVPIPPNRRRAKTSLEIPGGQATVSDLTSYLAELEQYRKQERRYQQRLLARHSLSQTDKNN